MKLNKKGMAEKRKTKQKKREISYKIKMYYRPFQLLAL